MGEASIWCSYQLVPDSKVFGANMGPIWDRQDPGGPHVGPMNFAICLNMKSYALSKIQISAKSIGEVYSMKHSLPISFSEYTKNKWCL